MRKVFFSFHFATDKWRVSQIRESHTIRKKFDLPPFFMDQAEWEKTKLPGEEGIKKWIDDNMFGASVVIVLIGEETYTRPWVLYEIHKAFDEQKAIMGINLEGLKNNQSEPCRLNLQKSNNPFVHANMLESARKIIPIYHWKNENGYENMDRWIEKAKKTFDEYYSSNTDYDWWKALQKEMERVDKSRNFPRNFV
ncbi:MAG TPA: TIR domain-containing protein [Alphaproteobacteria bacterium]|nr:TIR domain-containing protein [Alphaproteobacteria bacterium]